MVLEVAVHILMEGVMKIIIEQSDFHAIASAISCDHKLSDRIKDTARVLAKHIDNSRYHTVDCLMVGSIATSNATVAILKELITQILIGVEIVTEHGSHIKHKEILHAITHATKKVNDVFTDKHKKNIMDMLCQEKLDFEEFKKVRHFDEVKKDVKRGGKKKS